MTYVKKNQDTSPIATNLLYPDIPKGVPDKIQQKHQKAKSYHDRNVKVLPDLNIGQEVHIAPIHRGSYWKTGTCLQKFSDTCRSYLVETDGEVFQQNRQDKEAPTLLDEMNKLLKEMLYTQHLHCSQPVLQLLQPVLLSIHQHED